MKTRICLKYFFNDCSVLVFFFIDFSEFHVFYFSRVGAYSDLSVNGTVLIRGWRLFEAWRLLEEIRYPPCGLIHLMKLKSSKKLHIIKAYIGHPMFVNQYLAKASFFKQTCS